MFRRELARLDSAPAIFIWSLIDPGPSVYLFADP